jgi:hypothetical protein
MNTLNAANIFKLKSGDGVLISISIILPPIFEAFVITKNIG